MNKILISACLMGQNVRYDGKNSLITHPVIQSLKQQGRLVVFCPEVAGGLPTPRAPAEIKSRYPILVTTADQEDVTPQFLLGAELAVEKAQEVGACCAVLKSNSPSCGNREIYDGKFTNTLIPGSGVAASELQRHGFPVYNEHEIDQLLEFITTFDLSMNRHSA
ncbi:DUF523 domain-containing protein [Neptunomonas phycophila]|jgi:uncharacterized protein YbbK (DUF523 family)|uniref:DUF523 domain-containing protein n=1 Tax=Neptunomonas TaxID=75687 RepID=UPI000948C8D0|nr:DUF523 domain-containing protein [Neptunomonas phycophila]QLE97774.1 DUF523 domain-containing protein [Neptunomonas phycophila]